MRLSGHEINSQLRQKLAPASRAGRMGDQDLAPDDGSGSEHQVDLPGDRSRRTEGR